jgi:hypothetical protein
LNEHDLLIIETGGKLHLVDEPNGEVRELKDIKGLHNKQHFDFMRLDEAKSFHHLNPDMQEDLTQGSSINVSSMMPTSDESETDRGRRGGIRR